jgi:tetratricopeptide (TPR) repeat protein
MPRYADKRGARMSRRICGFATIALACVMALPNTAYANSIRDIQAGLEQEAHGDYAAAVALYSRALGAGDLSPLNRATAYLDRCNAYDLMGSFDRAIADCSTAVELSPTDGDTYADRCAAFNGKGDYGHGIADCSAAIQFDPNDPVAYNNRCDSYLESGDYTRAIADCEMAVRLRGDFKVASDDIALSRRCLIDMRLGGNSQADENCTAETSHHSVEAALFANLAEAYFEAGQFAPAIEDFEHAPSIYLGSLRREIWLSLAWARSGHAELATATLDQARVSPDTWDAVLVAFLKGDISARQVTTRAEDLSGGDAVRATCDADFLIGEQDLVRHLGAAARDVLTQVADRCSQVRAVEHGIAIGELRRLQAFTH